MIEVPRDLSDELFDKRMQSGAVFYWKNAPISGGRTKPKYCVIIGYIMKEIDEKDEEIFLFLYTTKETEKYERNGRFRGSGVFIPVSTLDCFDLDTVIQCNNLYSAPGELLREEFHKRNFVWKDNLPDTIWSAVTTTALSINWLSDYEKDLIKDALGY